MTVFVISWHVGKVKVCLYLLSESSLEASHAGDMHFSVEHQPNVRDVYERVEPSCLTLIQLQKERKLEAFNFRTPSHLKQLTNHFVYVEHIAPFTQNGLGLYAWFLRPKNQHMAGLVPHSVFLHNFTISYCLLLSSY